MSGLDNFWADIDAQLEALKSAATVDDVLRICPKALGVSTGHGFFAGGGGDYTPIDPLTGHAGWTVEAWEAPYYYCLRAPDGGLLSYVEGDLYRGNQLVTEQDPNERSEA